MNNIFSGMDAYIKNDRRIHLGGVNNLAGFSGW